MDYSLLPWACSHGVLLSFFLQRMLKKKKIVPLSNGYVSVSFTPAEGGQPVEMRFGPRSCLTGQFLDLSGVSSANPKICALFFFFFLLSPRSPISPLGCFRSALTKPFLPPSYPPVARHEQLVAVKRSAQHPDSHVFALAGTYRFHIRADRKEDTTQASRAQSFKLPIQDFLFQVKVIKPNANALKLVHGRCVEPLTAENCNTVIPISGFLMEVSHLSLSISLALSLFLLLLLSLSILPRVLFSSPLFIFLFLAIFATSKKTFPSMSWTQWRGCPCNTRMSLSALLSLSPLLCLLFRLTLPCVAGCGAHPRVPSGLRGDGKSEQKPVLRLHPRLPEQKSSVPHFFFFPPGCAHPPD